MYISSLELQDFRNYESLSVEFADGVNLFHGRNAQGKTNILEAVTVAGTTRSHKGSKDKDMIRHSMEEGHIRMHIVRNDGTHRIDIHLKRNKAKGIALDMLPVKRAGDVYGLLQFVIFSPEDLSIVKAGPAVRRRFLNQELCQTDKIYFKELAEYNRCLLQRQALLRLPDIEDRRDELSVWDAQLIRTGKKIIAIRKAFIEELSPIVRTIHAELTGGAEELSLRYEPSVSEADFEVQLALSVDNDIRYKETHVGPHRDDFSLAIGGDAVRVFGSQGQQRTAALSLKLAEIEMLRKKTGEMPVLLLDDVLSELDEERQIQLLKRIRGGQTFLTCTGLEDIRKNKLDCDRVFYVEDGTVIRENADLTKNA